MKTKSFQKYLEKRLNKDEIVEIEQQAQHEIKILVSLARMLADIARRSKLYTLAPRA